MGANKSDGVPVQYYRKGNNIIEEKHFWPNAVLQEIFYFISRVCKKGKQIVSSLLQCPYELKTEKLSKMYEQTVVCVNFPSFH